MMYIKTDLVENQIIITKSLLRNGSGEKKEYYAILYCLVSLCIAVLQAIKQTSVLPTKVIFRNKLLTAERFHFN